MDKLTSELQRLHFLSDQPPSGGQQALGLAFTRAADWHRVAELCRAVQEELELPAPAVSIDGEGYQLWFSLAEAVATDETACFLDGLQHGYLADLADSRLRRGLPSQPPPCQLPGDDRWAAFIDPGMGSMFVGEPWLDLPPNRNQQADLLAGCQRIGKADFMRALALLQPLADPAVHDTAGKASAPASTLSLRGEFTDPRQFLLAVMNDPQASAEQRIDAAKALLPYIGNAP